MRKVRFFRESVPGDKLSIFIPKTYKEISKILNSSIEEVEDFEIYLDQNIKPGQHFHGTIDTRSGIEHSFDEIKSEQDYLEMWYKFKSDGQVCHSHDYDGL